MKTDKVLDAEIHTFAEEYLCGQFDGSILRTNKSHVNHDYQFFINRWLDPLYPLTGDSWRLHWSFTHWD